MTIKTLFGRLTFGCPFMGHKLILRFLRFQVSDFGIQISAQSDAAAHKTIGQNLPNRRRPQILATYICRQLTRKDRGVGPRAPPQGLVPNVRGHLRLNVPRIRIQSYLHFLLWTCDHHQTLDVFRVINLRLCSDESKSSSIFRQAIFAHHPHRRSVIRTSQV